MMVKGLSSPLKKSIRGSPIQAEVMGGRGNTD